MPKNQPFWFHNKGSLMQRKSIKSPAPWWKFGHVWLVVAGPAIVVVASLVTFYLAVTRPDQVVTEDYYRKGIEINKTLGNAAQCRQHGTSIAGAQSCRDRRDTGTQARQTLNWMNQNLKDAELCCHNESCGLSGPLFWWRAFLKCWYLRWSIRKTFTGSAIRWSFHAKASIPWLFCVLGYHHVVQRLDDLAGDVTV